MAAFGAGEILLTSMDRDGTRDGFDLELTRAVADRVPIPVIASGGVGDLEHLYQGIAEGHAEAVLAASIFHFGEATVGQAHAYLRARGVPVRRGSPRRSSKELHDRHDEDLLDAVTFDANGLCPVIAQEARTGMVRMVAWANREALALTAATKAAHFWSRSRKALWRKGESSGHTLAVREMRIDCDGDVGPLSGRRRGAVVPHRRDLLLLSKGGRRRRDHRADDGPPDPPALVLARVADVIAERKRTRPEKSYVVSLLDAGLPKINGKIAEESRELIEALSGERRRAHRARGGRSDLPHAGRPGSGRRAGRRRLRPAAQALRDLRHRRKSEPQEMTADRRRRATRSARDIRATFAAGPGRRGGRDPPRLRGARRTAGDGRTDRRRHRRRRAPPGRGGDRHRQDAGLSGPGAALRPQGRGQHRDQDPAGSDRHRRPAAAADDLRRRRDRRRRTSTGRS